MEGCCLYRFIKTVNVSGFYDNVGGYVHQPNDMVWEFFPYLSDSKLQNADSTTANLYTLLAWMFERKKHGGRMRDQKDGCTKQYRCYIA